MSDTTSPAPNPGALPVIRLQPGRDRRLRHGHPWAFSNEIRMDAEAKALPPGALVRLTDAEGRSLGLATFNFQSLIAARLLTRDPGATVNRTFLAKRLHRALELRDRLYEEPYYRLVHSEADGLPGLIVDRYGDVLTVQLNTAGMQALWPDLERALTETLRPKAIVLRNDSPVRRLEGLDLHHEVALGTVEGPVPVRENGLTFFADLTGGQKTGWFFDQRDNRAFMARLSRSRRVLDVYSYSGGFTVAAAAAGATETIAVDRSAAALAQASKAAEENGVAARCRFVEAEAFAELEKRTQAGERFDVVIADPPAFVKSRKDLAAGAKGYRKLAKLAAGLVAPGGVLFIASCSHHMEPAPFLEQVGAGLLAAGRTGRILRSAGAGPDHPVHPFLPESAYLKALVLELD